ncbi:MAG TPA: DUF2007 domain-containing protein [Daejeonella sp.]|nr:DUF2007 domain-containing protein [Daejeonella sp.]
MEPNWVKVYTSPDFFKSEIVRQVLIDHEIQAVLLNKQLSAYNIGEVEVYVHQNHFDEAIELILKNEL